jgi:hypothetical protein
MKIAIFVFKNCLAFLAFLVFSVHFSRAQDVRKNAVIITNENVKIEAIILHADTLVVKYKKASDPEGPVFSIKNTEIFSIIRNNGEVENPAKSTKTNYAERFTGLSISKLKSDYKLYRRKAARYKNMGYTGIFTGLLLTGIGIAVLSHGDRTYTDPYGNSFTNGSNAAIGTLLVTAGLGAGIPLTIVGFVKNKKYGKRAIEVQNELRRRNQPLSLRLSPGFNPQTNTGYLSLKLAF